MYSLLSEQFPAYGIETGCKGLNVPLAPANSRG